MFKIKYSPNLSGEVFISASKNAALPILAANYLVDKKVFLSNLPKIIDVDILNKIGDEYLQNGSLKTSLTEKIRSSILLIPIGLYKFGKIEFSHCGGCNLGKRPLDTFDNVLEQAGIKIQSKSDSKIYTVMKKPNKKIILNSFSVTATEAILMYLSFLSGVDYEIEVANIAIEPHVIDLINFLKNLGAKITLYYDHTVKIKPSKINILSYEYKIVSDYIEAGTYFAIGAIADNTKLIIRNVNPSHLNSLFSLSNQIGINYSIYGDIIEVNSLNKKKYKPVKLQTMIYPGFPTDLQSIFGTLLTQIKGISKIHEVLFEGRFSYFVELENMGANVEILNPHEILIIGGKRLTGTYVNSRDLRAGASLILAGILAEGETYITNENIIKRGYENIVSKLSSIGVKIEEL